MKKRPVQIKPKPTTRDYIAFGIAVFLTIPSIAALVIATRFIGRMMRPTDFLLHYGTVSLLLGAGAAFLVARFAPGRTPADRLDLAVKTTRQGILFLTFMGTAALSLGLFSVINARLDRSAGTVEEAVVVGRDTRRLHRSRANYVTVSVRSTEKEFMVTRWQMKELEEGREIRLLLREGFLGYEHIAEVIISGSPGLRDEEDEQPS